MPQIWIRSDASGLQPVLLDERQELPGSGDADWHFVAVVEDRVEARFLMDQLQREHAELAAESPPTP